MMNDLVVLLCKELRRETVYMVCFTVFQFSKVYYVHTKKD